MAYQPKSYRKFLVGAVSTAVVASSFAGVAGAAANFTDVNSNYKEAVDFLVSKGISGISTTEFGTYQNIKRVDAAVFVVKALGLDVNAAPASGFTDVPDRAAKEVNALKAAGITSGKSATEFGAQDLITRGELAIWLDKAFKLQGEGDISAFTDANGIYTDAIKALVANNITKGTSATTFGTKDSAKRGDFAVFVQRADEAVSAAAVKSVTAENGKVTVQLTKTPETTPVAADFTVKQSINNGTAEAVVPSSFNWNADTNTATFSVTGIGARDVDQTVSYSVAFKDTTAKSGSFTVAKVSGLVVSSANVLDAKTLEIQFSKPVLESSVIAADNTLVDGVIIVEEDGVVDTNTVNIDGAFAKLSKDGLKLTVTLSDGAASDEFFKGKYTITVPTTPNAVKVTDKDGKALETKYVQILSVDDKTRPTITKVEYVDYETARIHFSEPISNQGTVSFERADGKAFAKDGAGAEIKPTASLKAAIDKDGRNYVDVDLSGLNSADYDTDINVKFIGTSDYAGNLVSPNPVTQVVKKDTTDKTAPTVADVKVLTSNTFELTFSEEVLGLTVNDIQINGTPLVAGTDTLTKDDNNSKKYKVELDTALDGLETVKIAKGAFTDKTNNALAEDFTKVVNFGIDTVKPTVSTTKVEKIDGVEYLVVSFNENVKTIDDKDITGSYVKDFITNDITLVTDNNNAGTASAVAAIVEKDVAVSLYNPVDDKSNAIKINLSLTPEKGAYTVKLPTGLVKDLSGNDSVEKEITFTRGEDDSTGKPKLGTADTNGITVVDNNSFTITFDRALDATTALNKANYAVEGATVESVALLSNSPAVIKVTLTKDSQKFSGLTNVTISGVKSQTGHVIDTVTVSELLTENVRPTVAKAEVSGSDKITLTFSEALTVASVDVDASDFELYIGGVKVSGVTASTTSDKVVLDLTSDLTATQLSQGLEVRASSTFDVTDLNTNKANFDKVTVSVN